jgi:CheY-like chemotaxis protein
MPLGPSCADAVAGYLSVGMTDYLPKPFNKNQLFNMLQVRKPAALPGLHRRPLF